jgi:hypothetical protein
MQRNVISVLLIGVSLFGGCFTEVGNPGKPPVNSNTTTVNFRIDYDPAAKTLAKYSGSDRVASPRATHENNSKALITQFYFNVVEANYTTLDSVNGRIWKLADSLGFDVDFTNQDTSAKLPPVQVPPDPWSRLKLESRIPTYHALSLDTILFESFSDRGYIKGYFPETQGRTAFLCQLPAVDKVNLLYDSTMLEKFRQGNAYQIEVTFFATRWLATAPIATAIILPDRMGKPVALFDLEHNRDLYDTLRWSFFKSFNSLKVQKEGAFVP